MILNIFFRRYFYAILSCLMSTTAYSQDIYLKSAKKIASHLQSNETDSVHKYFEESLKEKLTAGQLKTVWTQLQMQAGTLLTFDEAQRDTSMVRPLYTVEMAFEKMNLQLRLPFDSLGQLVGFFMAPGKSKTVYTSAVYDAKNYTEKALFVSSGKYKLKAILTLPDNSTNPPVAILVHGSGPHDMDETIDPNKPFKDLAVGFAKNGIATLRYDKRTFTYAKDFMGAARYTPDEEVNDDALAAIILCRETKETASSKLFLMGHSLGALMAPYIATQTKDLSGIILMGGNARPLEDVYYDQVNFILGQDSLTYDEQRKLADIRKQCDRVKQPLDETLDPSLLPLQLAPSYWNWLRTYKQTDVASKLSLPILILQANNDYQVTKKEFELWKLALGKNKNVTFKDYPGLFHLFIKGKGLPSDYEQTGHVEEQVISDMSDWIKKAE